MVTRGNVAIYCYNALTAKMWDVEESTNGELTSKRSGETILAKYFADFTNEKGEMKLVEEAYVELSGANTTEIGKNQIKLVAEVENKAGNLVDIATFIDAEKAPKKGEEEVTYKKGDDVIAYVPAEVASTANLAGKKVDVIFGEDNEVAYLVVTDDAVEGSYVTALDGDEIEIDGEEYELASNVVVAVYGHKLNTVWDEEAEVYTDGIAKITELFGTLEALEELIEADSEINPGVVYCINEDDEFERNIIADVTLNGDDEIETINFKFSIDGFSKLVVDADSEEDDEYLEINEFIVEKISNKNVLTTSTNSEEKDDLDDYEDAEPRVIKNGEVAEVSDIAVGDVVTEVVYDGEVELMIVVSNTIEGTLEDLYKNAFEIDGTEYKVVTTPYYNEEGEVNDLHASDAETMYDSYFEDEEVTAYVNMAGEVVALVGETEATGTILGVVTSIPTDEYDKENEVTYYEVKILAEDGTNRYYNIYKNNKKNKDLDDAPVALNNVIIFEANADREVIVEDIQVVSNGTYDIGSNNDLLVEVKDTVSVETDPNKLDNYRFSSSTVVINPVEKDIISWDALVNSSDDTLATTGKLTLTGYESVPTGESNDDYTKLGDLYYKNSELEGDDAYANADVYLFSKDDTKVVYVIAWVEEFHYGVSDTQYGILLNVDDERDEDNEKVWYATLLVDGKEVKYECESTLRSKKGSFVSFDVSDGEIDDITELADKDVIEYIDDLRNDEMDLDGYVAASLSEATSLKSITVDNFDEADGNAYIVCEKYTPAGEDEETQNVYDLAEDYIIYSLSDAEMLDEVQEGDYVFVIDTNEPSNPDDFDGYEIVIVL